MKLGNATKIQHNVLFERIKELKQELQEFAILEVEAETERDKIKWSLRVAETKELLKINTTGLELVEEVIRLESQIEETEDFDELMPIFEAIEKLVKKYL